MMNMNTIVLLDTFRAARTRNDDDTAKSLERDIKSRLLITTDIVDALIDMRGDDDFEEYDIFVQTLLRESRKLLDACYELKSHIPD